MVNVVKCASNESTSVDSDDNVEIIASDWKIIEFVLNFGYFDYMQCTRRVSVFVQSLEDLRMVSAALVPCNVVHEKSRFISIKHLLKSISFIFLLATVLPPDCHWLCMCMWLSIASYFLICHHSHVLTTFQLSVRCRIRWWRSNGRIIPFCCFFLLSGLKYRHYSAFSSRRQCHRCDWQHSARRRESIFHLRKRYLKTELMYATRVVCSFHVIVDDVGVVAACRPVGTQDPFLYVMCATVSNQKTATEIYGASDSSSRAAAAAIAPHYPEVIVYQMKVDHFLSLFHFFYFLFIRFMLFVFFFSSNGLRGHREVCVCV